jgi:hypothetical protein
VVCGLALTAGEAAAQNKTRWVMRCEYTSSRGGSNPYIYSKAFAFEAEANMSSTAMADEWFAFLSTKYSSIHRSFAACQASPEGAPRYVLELLSRSGKTFEELNWMPAYGVAYALPREMYYYCVAPEEGLARQFVTDLFTTPFPSTREEFHKLLADANSAHAIWMRGQGMRYNTTNMGCDAIGPEPFQAYTVRLDGYAHRSDPTRYALTRSPWPGLTKAIAPNLIDDLTARARYARMRINAPAATAKTAPPPAAPPRTPAQISKPALTIKTDTSLRDAGKVWDEQVKKTLADEARKKVETAAKTAQANAEVQADMEAFFRERRKQGRAQ